MRRNGLFASSWIPCIEHFLHIGHTSIMKQIGSKVVPVNDDDLEESLENEDVESFKVLRYILNKIEWNLYIQKKLFLDYL